MEDQQLIIHLIFLKDHNISYNKSITMNNLYEHFKDDIEVIEYLDNLKMIFRKEKFDEHNKEKIYIKQKV